MPFVGQIIDGNGFGWSTWWDEGRLLVPRRLIVKRCLQLAETNTRLVSMHLCIKDCQPTDEVWFIVYCPHCDSCCNIYPTRPACFPVPTSRTPRSPSTLPVFFKVELVDSGLDDLASEALFGVLLARVGTIRKLDLGGNRIGVKGATGLARFIAHKGEL